MENNRVMVTPANATNRREWGRRAGYDQQENGTKQAKKLDVKRVTENGRGEYWRKESPETMNEWINREELDQ